jgi:DNA-binding PadR family transcriptional regulator
MSMATVSIRQLVLGLLAQEPMSGYDIRRYLKSLNWLVGSPSFGSLYPTLRALLQDGLVTVDIVLRSDRPACKIYQVTQEGERALQELLDKPAAADPSLETFVKRLVLAANLSPSRLVADLEERRAQVSAYCDSLDRIAASLDGQNEPERRLAIDFGLAMARAETAWIDEALGRLSQQTAMESRTRSGGSAYAERRASRTPGDSAKNTPRRRT